VKIFKTRSSRLANEKNVDVLLKTTTPLSENIDKHPVNEDVVKDLTVVVERLDDSVLSKIPVNKSYNNVTNTETNEVIHPLDSINDSSSSSSSDEEFTRKLRSHKVVKTDKKEKKKI